MPSVGGNRIPKMLSKLITLREKCSIIFHVRFQLSKSLPASLQGDEPTEPTEVDEDRGPRDERESYRREKRFWKRGSKATSIMSTGNVVASTKNSPTSMTDRKSRVTIENNVACGNVVDWQNIPKVEIVQHVDDDDDNEESENESPPSPGKEEEKKNETGTNGPSSRGPRWWWRSGQCIHLTTDQSWVRISVSLQIIQNDKALSLYHKTLNKMIKIGRWSF